MSHAALFICLNYISDESLVYENRQRRRSGCSRSPWKAMYLHQKQIEYNWRQGPIRSPKVGEVIPFIITVNDLFSASALVTAPYLFSKQYTWQLLVGDRSDSDSAQSRLVIKGY